MAGIYSSPLRGFNDKWSAMPGYTDFGELSNADKTLLNNYSGLYGKKDVVWGVNGLKGTFRKLLGRDPYAVNTEFIQSLRKNPSMKASLNYFKDNFDNYMNSDEIANAFGNNASKVTPEDLYNLANNTYDKAAFNAKFPGLNTGAINGGTQSAGAATDAGGGGGGLKGFFGKFNEGFGGKPFKLDGKTLGSAANKVVTYAPAAIEGFKALGNLSDYDEASDAVDDYVSKINALASGTPMLDSYLTADQLSQLRKLQRGTYDTDFNMSDALSDPMSVLKGAGQGALAGLPALLTGNFLPMLIGAGGGAINAGIQNATQGYEDDLATLEELYNALQYASQDYKSMRRPNFQGLGIQQRYQDMYR